MDQLRELIGQLKLFCRLDVAFCEKIEEHDKEVYALKEDNKRLLATVRALETKYSEMLYILNSLKKDLK